MATPIKVTDVKAADPHISFILYNTGADGNPSVFGTKVTVKVEMPVMGFEQPFSQGAHIPKNKILSSVVTVNNAIEDSDIHIIIPIGDSNWSQRIGSKVPIRITVERPGMDKEVINVETTAQPQHFLPARIDGTYELFFNSANELIAVKKRHAGFHRMKIFSLGTPENISNTELITMGSSFDAITQPKEILLDNQDNLLFVHISDDGKVHTLRLFKSSNYAGTQNCVSNSPIQGFENLNGEWDFFLDKNDNLYVKHLSRIDHEDVTIYQISAKVVAGYGYSNIKKVYEGVLKV